MLCYQHCESKRVPWWLASTRQSVLLFSSGAWLLKKKHQSCTSDAVGIRRRECWGRRVKFEARSVISVTNLRVLQSYPRIEVMPQQPCMPPYRAGERPSSSSADPSLQHQLVSDINSPMEPSSSSIRLPIS